MSLSGPDVACAGVSALSLTLVEGLQEIAGIRLSEEHTSGYMVVCWQHMNEIGRALIDTWFLGISAIANEYNCIRFE